MSTIRIKICGITSATDARAAVEAGADYIGLNFFPPASRSISFDDAPGWEEVEEVDADAKLDAAE